MNGRNSDKTSQEIFTMIVLQMRFCLCITPYSPPTHTHGPIFSWISPSGPWWWDSSDGGGLALETMCEKQRLSRHDTTQSCRFIAGAAPQALITPAGRPWSRLKSTHRVGRATRLLVYIKVRRLAPRILWALWDLGVLRLAHEPGGDDITPPHPL